MNQNATYENGTPAWGARRGPVMPYIPAVDGLRALSVIAVIVYHANKSWLGGGFLGVEVFFVISGYLITLLLLAERERTGTVTLRNFWMRRARRLLPALWTLLLSITIWCVFFDRERLGMLRGDVVGAFVYMSNWFNIWSGSSYTSSFSFAPLRHLWSLAVEEQYYLLWPIVMFVVLKRMRQRLLPFIGLFFVVIAVVIAVVTAVMYQTGPIDTFAKTPHQYMSLFGHRVLRIDFLYLGTFSRATGLFLGSGLAMMWRPWALARGKVIRTARALDLLGVGAIAALSYMAWNFRTVVEGVDVGQHGYDLLYRGGFFLVGLASIVVIAAVTHPRSELGRWVIGNPLFVWVGVRSYGLYLYHWPIFQIYRKSAGTPLTVEQFGWLMLASLVVTELSYQFIEMPIRRGKLMPYLRTLRASISDSQAMVRRRAGTAVLVVSLLPIFAVGALVTADVVPDEITQNLNDNEDAVTDVMASSTTSATTLVVATSTPATLAPVKRIDVLAIGDSVMLGAARKLKAKGITVDAEKNRQFHESLQIFGYLKATRELGDNVVIHLGTNNGTTKQTLDRIMKALVDVKLVVFLTTHVPTKGWQQETNALIAALPKQYPNAKVIYWNAITKDHPEYFAGDKVHLKPAGQDFYVAQIMAALGRS